jgi:hypothetical protein
VAENLTEKFFRCGVCGGCEKFFFFVLRFIYRDPVGPGFELDLSLLRLGSPRSLLEISKIFSCYLSSELKDAKSRKRKKKVHNLKCELLKK